MLQKAAVLFLTLMFSVVAHAGNWTASLKCNSLLDPQKTVTDLVSQIANEALRQFHHPSRAATVGYRRLLENVSAVSLKISLPDTIDSDWVYHLPASHQKIWPQLSAAQKLELVEGLERSFSFGIYDTDLIPDDGENLGNSIARTETLKALSRNPGMAYSPFLFLGAALDGQKIGLCRHYNLAFALLLVELGIPTDDVRIVIGQEPNRPESHVYLEVRVDGIWTLADGIPHDGTPLEIHTHDEHSRLFHRRTQALMYRQDYGNNIFVQTLTDIIKLQKNPQVNESDEFFDDLLRALSGAKKND